MKKEKKFLSLIFKWNVYFEGEGTGILQIVAESGSLQSEIYVLEDCVVYDKATTGEKSTDWESTSLTVTTDTTGTTLSGAIANYKSTKVLTGDFQLDVELKSEGNFRFYLINSTNTVYSTKFLSQEDWGYWRVIRQGSTLTLQYSSDGVTYANQSWNDNNIGSTDCYFQLANLVADRTISYRNLKAY